MPRCIMNIRELYENRDAVLAKAFTELQAKSQLLNPKLKSPGVLKDDFLNEWLALNYLWTVHFKSDGSPIMGEIGGIIPTHPEHGKQVLAIAQVSMEKVIYGAKKIKESEKTGAKDIISQLEREIEMPLEYRDNVTVVNGNRNVAHYDFTTSVARENPLDLFTTNVPLLLRAEGMLVMSQKCLDGEQYIFNVPYHPELFDKIKKTNEVDPRLEILKSNKEIITPNNFIAGFQIMYQEKDIIIRPLIGEKERNAHSKYLKDNGILANPSNIVYLGASDPQGTSFSVIERKILG